jgi:acyl-CoA synthetase (AMP-forming)/AMP-acid ligase II
MSLADATARLTAPGAPFEMDEIDIRGVKTRVWKNAPLTLRQVFAVGRSHGQRTFLVYEDDRATYEAFCRAALAFAAELQGRGVVKGDRVAIAMRNTPEWVVAFFATTLIGAIATPLNAWWTEHELAYGLSNSAAKVLVVDPERLARIAHRRDDLPDLELVYVARGTTPPPAGVTPLEAVIGPVNAWPDLPEGVLPDTPLGPEDEVTLFYTSGTTGAAKGVVGTHRAICTTIFSQMFARARTYVRRGEPLPVRDASSPQLSYLLTVPLFHTTGCKAVLVPVFYDGAKLAMLRRWDCEAAMKVIERERITSTGGVPTIALQLLAHPARADYDLSSLISVSYGGAPAPADLADEVRRNFPAALPACGWGMTETSATFTNHQGEDYLNRPESAGPAVAVCDMKILGEDGRELPRGEVGELWAKGPNVAKGYWRQPEADAATFVDGWLRTGDLAYIDEEGFLFVVGRAKDIIIRGGENILCAEVERALLEHPAVMDAAVVPVAHPTLGEEPAAVINLHAGATPSEDELKRFVAERLAGFKVPVRIVAAAELLPRNPAGKLDKRAIARQLA